MTLIIKIKINLKEIYFSYIKIPKIFFFILIVSFNMLFFNFCLAENSNLNPNSETEITIKPKANKYSKWPEASYKRIYVNAGTKTSYQYHEQKLETNFLIEGTAELWLENDEGVVEKKITPFEYFSL